MNRTVKEIKRQARQNLIGQYRVPMKAAVLVALLPALVMMSFSDMLSDSYGILPNVLYYSAEFLISVITYVIYSGETMIHMCICRRQDYVPKDVFYCFGHAADHYAAGSILRYVLHLIAYSPLITALWLAVFAFDTLTFRRILLVAGLALAGLLLDLILDVILSMYFFVVLDEEDARIRENLTTALDLIRGSRWKFFCLLLSFIGMDLLVLLSMGIGSLWVTPYRLQSMTVFYMDLTGDSCLAEA